MHRYPQWADDGLRLYSIASAADVSDPGPFRIVAPASNVTSWFVTLCVRGSAKSRGPGVSGTSS